MRYNDTLILHRDTLDVEFTSKCYDSTTGKSLDTLEAELKEMICQNEKQGVNRSITKATCFARIINEGMLSVSPYAYFAENVNNGGLVNRLCYQPWLDALMAHPDKVKKARSYGDYLANNGVGSFWLDFGHIAPDWEIVTTIGFTGILERINSRRQTLLQSGEMTPEKQGYFDSASITYKAVLSYLGRLKSEVDRQIDASTDNKEGLMLLSCSLDSISRQAPQNFHEALLTIDIMFYLLEMVMCTRTRTLGGLDRLLYPFYKADIDSGAFTDEELRLFMRQFLFRMWAMRIPYDLPFMLGGLDRKGNCVVNPVSYLIVEEYNKLNIHSPKIHIRANDKTPDDFLLLVLEAIRNGNSSFVFCNDEQGIRSLEKIGIETEDARVYTPYGCYEQGAAGTEVPCTGNGKISMPKCVLYALCGGYDFKYDRQVGLETPLEFESFDEFYGAYEKQFFHFVDMYVYGVAEYEEYYGEVHPEPLISPTFNSSIEKGVDLFNRGGKYNNSSMSVYGVATCADSLVAIKQAVFDKRLCTLEEMRCALRDNFVGHEKLRAILLKCDKYGNNLPESNAMTDRILKTASQSLVGKKNGRGGVFKLSAFTINLNIQSGAMCGATPDGRLCDMPLSKNLCATPAMDKEGVTALIGSATSFDHSSCPNGLVLDVVLHPSAVAGKEGLKSFLGILKTYFEKGGFAFQANIFNAETLKQAQLHPEEYKNLQVRVCGWNVFFVNLSKIEQDIFITQAENA